MSRYAFGCEENGDLWSRNSLEYPSSRPKVKLENVVDSIGVALTASPAEGVSLIVAFAKGRCSLRYSSCQCSLYPRRR